MNAEWNDFVDYYLKEIKPIRKYTTQDETAVLPNGITLTLRPEREENRCEVEELTRRTFWRVERRERLGGIGCDEHYLCRTLRYIPEFIPELNLVAEYKIDGECAIVSNVMFTVGLLKNRTGEKHAVLIFGPLSVLPEFRFMGVGGVLMRRAIVIARSAGWEAIFVYGHPTYYPKLGFREAAEFGVTTHDGKNYPAFMAMELKPGFLREVGGAFYYTPVFDVDEEAAREFDASLVPITGEYMAKKLTKLHLPYIHRLLNRPEILSALHELPTEFSVWERAFKIWADEGECNFIIYTEEKPAGWLKLNGFDGGGTGWISELVIDPSYWRRGLGSYAVSFAEKLFMSQGLRHAAIHTNEDNAAARACYEKCGYKVTERGECTNSDGVHRFGLTYEKAL
jgi:Predicted acetyltransferase